MGELRALLLARQLGLRSPSFAHALPWWEAPVFLRAVELKVNIRLRKGGWTKAK